MHLILLLAYVLGAMMFIGDIGGGSARMWPLLIPIGIIVGQWIRPTILGWVIIIVPTILYFAVGVYYLVANNIGAHPQWEDDAEGVILGSFFLAALLVLCTGLIFAAKPTK
jgi:hypothetical protein